MKESYMKKRISERRKCWRKLQVRGELEILVWTGGGEMEVPPMYLALRVGKNDITQEGMAPRKPSDWENPMGQVGVETHLLPCWWDCWMITYRLSKGICQLESLLLGMLENGSENTPVAMRTCRTQILASKYYSPLKEYKAPLRCG